MGIMKKSLLFLTLCFSTLILSSCGYQGNYRYPCQDPANWQSADCKPPLCDVDKTCPKDLNSNLKGDNVNG